MQPRKRTIILLILSLLTVMMVSRVAYAGDNPQQATFVTPKLVVNTSFLNIRTGPGTQYSVLITVVGGTELPVLGVAKDLVWYQVATNVGVGWVNVEFTLARGDFTRVPFAEPGPVVAPAVVVNPGQGGGGAPAAFVSSPPRRITGVSITGGDLRAAPGDNQPNIRPALSADPLNVYPVSGVQDINGDVWYLVTIPGVGTGWMNKVVLRPIKCNPGDFIVSMTVRDSGVPEGTEGYVVGVFGDFFNLELIDGSVHPVAAAATVARPSNVISHCPSGVSFTAASAGQGGGGTPPTFTVPTLAVNRVVVNTGNLNVRSGPGGNFSIITRVTGGTELAIIGRAPDDMWFLVQGYFGQGWVDSEFVVFRGDFSSVPIIRDAYSGGAIVTAVINAGQGGGGGAPTTVITTTTTTTTVPTIATNNRFVVNTGNLNVRSGPGGGFSVITTVPGGTELPIVGRAPDGVWFLVQGGFGQGWVNIEFGIFRGDYSSVPIIGS